MEVETYAVEGRPWWNLASDGQYEGPFWQVLAFGDSRFLPAPHLRQPWHEKLQWVSRYSVEVRADIEQQAAARGVLCLGLCLGAPF